MVPRKPMRKLRELLIASNKQGSMLRNAPEKIKVIDATDYTWHPCSSSSQRITLPEQIRLTQAYGNILSRNCNKGAIYLPEEDQKALVYVMEDLSNYKSIWRK
ncbi:hypothetical protein ACH5RR_029387 [Cinchona calisaya]|uniref:Uncharacterized protein n=1 Tax=Cinchona calisaya TaxID=153742 RepID=A0ABD2YSY3_9GENT